MLEHFTHDTFASRVGETFAVDGPGMPTQSLVLAEVAEARLEGWRPPASTKGGAERAAEGDPPARRPFTLWFVGSPQVILPQQIYRFQHQTLGTFEVFIVPIGRDAQGTRYEAIFT